ncbi:glycosyltransferase family 4 protein [Thalassomonas viridans]|uniref:Glycosyltransferase family 4 protein n=1 Tax=Thalassomonas viridans TaxID=137584 RepID=A0AAE9Z1N9_9GAMM|nr:glycosyltransferase family 4 protein [Thalassomonas viridans]WDE05005.1 glycosyltransferase family 4 protein [Thalassomonas viridans]
MINVLHLRSSAGLYGAEHVILNLTGQSSLFCHHELAVIQNYLNDNNELYTAARENGVTCHKLPNTGKFDLNTLKALRRILKSSKIDVLHCHDPKSVFYATLATLLSRSPKKVVTMHGWVRNDLKMKFNNLVEKFCLPLFARVIAVSKEISQDLTGQIRRDKIFLLENAIDTEKFHPAEKLRQDSKAQVNLLIVGRLSPEKGHENLLTALAQLNHEGNSNWHLNIVGDGELKEMLLATSKRLELSGQVTFHGVQKNMLPYYQQNDFYISSSLTEGMPLVILEALSCRLPVVATPVGAIPELLQKSQGGILCDDCSPQALHLGLSRIFALEPARREEMTAAGRKYIEDHLSLSRAREKHENLYAELLN